MKDGLSRSPLFYVGDKYKLIREIRSHFPSDIDRFFEPFVGGGSVFMNVEANAYFLNDIDRNIISIHKKLSSYAEREDVFFNLLFKCIRKYNLSLSFKEDVIPPELKKAFPKTYIAHYNKEAYAKMRDDFNCLKRKDYLLLYVLLIYGFNRILRFNKSGAFNLPVGNVDFNLNTHNALRDYFSALRSKKVEWSHYDFRKFINNHSYTSKDLIYLDPPYLISYSEYNKLWNEQFESDLLSLLDKLNKNKVRFALSNVTHYRGRVNQKLLDWSSKYNVYPIKSNYISFNDNSIKKFNEVLITNY